MVELLMVRVPELCASPPPCPPAAAPEKLSAITQSLSTNVAPSLKIPPP